MEYFAGIDVSLKESSVCVVDTAGKVVREVKVASEPEALVRHFDELGTPVSRIGLEPGCRVALNSNNAPVRARCCSIYENLLARYYQLCCNNDNVAVSDGAPSMVAASSIKRVRF